MMATLRNLKQRDIALVVIVLVALIAVAWWFLLYQPVRERISEVKMQIERLDAQIIQGEQAKAALPELRQAVAELEADKAAFLQALPRTNEIAKLLNQLTESAVVAEVVLESINNNGASAEDIQDVRQLDFSVATRGVYGSTLTFLRSLEALSNGRFSKVNGVNFSVESVDENSENLPEGSSIENPPLSTNYDFSVFVYIGDDSAPEGNEP